MGLFAIEGANADEAAEPPLSYAVTIGDKTITLADGEAMQLDGVFTNPRVMVQARSHRVFPYQGIHFHYPKAFTFEADLTDPTTKSWTLSGNDFKIMIFAVQAQLTAAEYPSSMVGQFGAENAKVVNQNARISLGKENLSGATLHVELVGTRMVMDVYGVPAPGGTSKLLVFQDTLNDRGQRTKEGKETLDELEASFVLER